MSANELTSTMDRHLRCTRWAAGQFVAIATFVVVAFALPQRGFAQITISSSNGYTVNWNGNQFWNSTVSTNLASASGTANAFGSAQYNTTNHAIVNINDGLYGNAESWLPALSGSGSIGVRFTQAADVTSFAWSRDNSSSPQYVDRSIGTYTVQFTTVASPGTATLSSDWTTVAAITLSAATGGYLPSLRHEFTITDSSGRPISGVTGIRIITSNEANAICIDELQVFRQVYRTNGSGSLFGTGTYATAASGGTTTTPYVGDVLAISASTAATQTITLGGSSNTVRALRFSTADAVNLTAGGTNSTLTLGYVADIATGGASGLAGTAGNLATSGGTTLTLDAGAGAVTIGSSTSGQQVAIALNASNTWVNNSSNTLTVNNGIARFATDGVSRMLSVTGSGNTVIAGAISNSGTAGSLALAKSGTGSLTLSASNSYTGGTTLNAGRLGFAANALGTGTVTMNGGTLRWESGNTQDISSRLQLVSGSTATFDTNGNNVTFASGFGGSTSAAVVKTGAGRLTLSGSNSYTGSTTISGGTLAVNGWLGGSPITVSSGGVLAGSGTVGSVTVASGAGIGPGNSPGTLTTGAMTWNGGGFYDWQLYNASGTAGTGWDFISGTGGLTIAATSGNKFTINLLTLSSTGPDVSGNALGFSSAQSGMWAIGSFTSITGFDTSTISLNTTGFSNPYSGLFSLATSGGTLNLVYTALGSSYTAGTGVWSDATNWSGGVTPSGTAQLSFTGTGGTSTNDISAATLPVVSSIAFPSNAGPYTLAGPLPLGGDIINSGTTTQTLSGSVSLVAASSLNAPSGKLVLTGTLATNGYTLTTVGSGVTIGDGGTSGVILGDVTTNGVLTFNRSDSITESDVIRGSGSIVKLGAGALTLSASNSYSGGTTLSAGSLNINNASALGTGALTVAATGTIDNTSGSALTLAANNPQAWNADFTFAGSNPLNLGTGSLSLGASQSVTVTSSTLTSGGAYGGSGALTKAGAGTLVLNGISTHSGTISVTAGTLQIGNTGTGGGSLLAMTNAAGVGVEFTGTAATIGVLNGGGALGGGVKLNNTTLTVNVPAAANNTSYSGVISGNGTLVKEGTQAWRLQSQQTFSGSAAFNNGFVVLSASNTLNPTTVVSVNGAGVDLGAQLQTWAGLSGSAGGVYSTAATGQALTLNVASGTSFSFSGALGAFTYSGPSFSVIKSGGGTQVLNGTAATYTGGTVLNEGTLGFASNSLGTSGTITLNGGSLRWETGNTQDISSRLRLVSGSTATLDTNGNNVTLATGFGGSTSASLVKTGSGILTLSGSNTYTGTTTVNAGSLQIGASGSVGSLSSSSPVSVSSGATLIFSRTDNYGGAFSNSISGAGGILVGGGVLALAGTNTYTGATTVTGGQLSVSANGQLPAASAVAMNGGQLALAGNLQLSNTITINGGGVAGQGIVYQSTGSGTVSGPITIIANASAGGHLGAAPGAALFVSGPITYTSGTVVGRAGTVVVSGGGSYAEFWQAADTVRLGASNGLATNAGLGLAGSTSATFDLAGFNQSLVGLRRSGTSTTATIGNSSTTSDSALTLTGTSSYDGTIVDSVNGGTRKVSLTYNGSGALTLSASNTFTGGVRINSGTVVAGVASALGTGTVTLSGGVLQPNNIPGVTQTPSFSNAIAVSGSGRVVFPDLSGLSGAVTGGVSDVLTFESTGRTSNTSNFSGFAGTLVLNSGAFNQLSTGRDLSTVKLSMRNNASLSSGDLGASFLIGELSGEATNGIGGGAGNAVLSLTVGQLNTSSTFAGAIANTNFAASLGKVGTGVLTLSGSNTYTGATSVYAGTLQLGAGSTTGWLSTSSAITGSSGATLAFNRTNAVSQGTDFGNGISGGLGLSQIGSGTLSLTGTNTFSGTTTISAGVIAIDSANALQNTSRVSIGGGAGLRYTGGQAAFSRNITVSSGTGTVTNAGSGMLTLSGTLTKNGTVLRLTGGAFDVTGVITGANANSDLVVDAATVTLSNTNTYNGPTFVQNSGTLILGVSNAIPSNSAVSVDGSTLTVGAASNTIGSLTTSGNSTINISINGGSGGSLSMGNLSFGGGTNTLAVSMTSATAGIYNLLTYSGNKTGSFSTSGVDSNYTVLTGSASNGVISLQRKAEFGLVTATPASASIIVGGSTAFSYTAVNATPTGGATLSFTSTNGSNVVGSSSGLAAAAATSTSVSGLSFTAPGVGLAQTGSFTLSDPNAIGTSAAGVVTVNVLNHSLASFAAIDTASKALDFGTYDTGSALWSGGDGGNGTLGYSLFNIASGGFTNAETAGLDLYDWSFTSGDNVFGVGLSAFANLAAGSSNPFSATVQTPGSLAAGSYSGVYTLKFRDQSLPGATNTRDLSLTMSVIVVPEPSSLVIAAVGISAAAWAAGRRRRRAS